MIFLFIFSAISGLLLFRGLLLWLPRLERKESLVQKGEVIKEALKQKNTILEGARHQAKEHLTVMSEELETSIMQKNDDLQLEEKEIEAREQFFEGELQRVAKLETTHATKEAEVIQLADIVEKKKERTLLVKAETISALEVYTEMDAKQLVQSVTSNLTAARQLECQKVLKFIQEEVSSSSQKLARRLLDRIHARYAPNFAWPKSTNFIEVSDPALFAKLAEEESPLLAELRELSEVKILPIVGEESKGIQHIKVVGGFGIYREAVRLAIEELVSSSSKNQWGKSKTIYNKYKLKLEHEAEQLGKKAVTILHLQGIHPEVQKLIGALNWRTSYRQNQWYHTVEVAELAGILGAELGVNPDDAKRVGLLHDIGKAIDYRIEGSHAVISGDYADRFGEKRYICDTVMSHHADLKVDTPLAYILQAADTLSGARPGARVNLEEGYQIRLSAIYEVIESFAGIIDIAVMNGGREVHVKVNHNKVAEKDVKNLTQQIVHKIEEDVAYPGQIKILVTRTFESSIVA